MQMERRIKIEWERGWLVINRGTSRQSGVNMGLLLFNTTISAVSTNAGVLLHPDTLSQSPMACATELLKIVIIIYRMFCYFLPIAMTEMAQNDFFASPIPPRRHTSCRYLSEPYVVVYFLSALACIRYGLQRLGDCEPLRNITFFFLIVSCACELVDKSP